MTKKYTHWSQLGLLDGENLTRVKDVNDVARKVNHLARISSSYGLVDPDNGHHVNYGVGAIIIAQTQDGPRILVDGVNTTQHQLTINNKEIKQSTDGHAETNALRMLTRMIKNKHIPLEDVDFTAEGFWDGVELWTNIQPCHLCCGTCSEMHMPTRYLATDEVITPADQMFEEGLHREHVTGTVRQEIGKVSGGIFKGQKIDPKLSEQASEIFEASTQNVRRWKAQSQAISETSHVRDLHVNSGKDKVFRRLVTMAMPDRHSYVVNRHIKAFDAHGNITPEAMDVLVAQVIKSHKGGRGELNGALIVDPQGYVFDTIHDLTHTKGKLRTPVMRAVNRIEKIRAGLGDFGDQLGATNSFQIISWREISQMEYGRLANVYGPKIHMVQADPTKGMISTGAWKKTHDMYQSHRGMNTALAMVPDTKTVNAAKQLVEEYSHTVKPEKIYVSPHTPNVLSMKGEPLTSEYSQMHKKLSKALRRHAGMVIEGTDPVGKEALANLTLENVKDLHGMVFYGEPSKEDLTRFYLAVDAAQTGVVGRKSSAGAFITNHPEDLRLRPIVIFDPEDKITTQPDSVWAIVKDRMEFHTATGMAKKDVFSSGIVRVAHTPEQVLEYMNTPVKGNRFSPYHIPSPDPEYIPGHTHDGKKMQVFVCCSFSTQNPLHEAMAESLGRVLAPQFDLITGGGRSKLVDGVDHGMMYHVQKGMHEAGGHVTGVTFSRLNPLANHEGHGSKRYFIDSIIKTHGMPDRISTMTNQSNVIFIDTGGLGTDTEAFAPAFIGKRPMVIRDIPATKVVDGKVWPDEAQGDKGMHHHTVKLLEKVYGMKQGEDFFVLKPELVLHEDGSVDVEATAEKSAQETAAAMPDFLMHYAVAHEQFQGARTSKKTAARGR